MKLVKNIVLTVLQIIMFLPMLLIGGLSVLLLGLAIYLSALYISKQTLRDFVTNISNKK